MEEEACAEQAMTDAEYVAWQKRQWSRAVDVLDRDPRDDGYDPDDPNDRLEVERGRL